jgi:hypothetical protein
MHTGGMSPGGSIVVSGVLTMAADVGIRASRIQNHASGMTRAKRIIQDRPAVVPDRLGRFASRLLRTDHDLLGARLRLLLDHRGIAEKSRQTGLGSSRAGSWSSKVSLMRCSCGLTHTTFRSRISSTRQNGNVSLTVSGALCVHSVLGPADGEYLLAGLRLGQWEISHPHQSEWNAACWFARRTRRRWRQNRTTSAARSIRAR